MSTNTRSIELNPFQRQGLETVVERLREVLWLCVDGDVSFEADEYIQSHVLGGCIETPRRKISEEEENRFRQQLVNNGTLFAVFRLFRELDQENVSGYCEEIQFPGSQVWSCYNYVSELIQPWNRWRAAKSQSEHGRASTAIAAFLTPEEEQRKPIALQKIRDKIKFFEDVLTGVKPETEPPRYSAFREPQEWLRLRKRKGLAHSRNIWQTLLKRHGTAIDCESKKSARISFALATEWGLNLPEFDESATH